MLITIKTNPQYIYNSIREIERVHSDMTTDAKKYYISANMNKLLEN